MTMPWATSDNNMKTPDIARLAAVYQTQITSVELERSDFPYVAHQIALLLTLCECNSQRLALYSLCICLVRACVLSVAMTIYRELQEGRQPGSC